MAGGGKVVAAVFRVRLEILNGGLCLAFNFGEFTGAGIAQIGLEVAEGVGAFEVKGDLVGDAVDGDLELIFQLAAGVVLGVPAFLLGLAS